MRNRKRTIGIFAFVAIAGFFMLSTVRGTPILSGSTYSRAPGGYGAWYAYAQTERELTIHRWQQPLPLFFLAHPGGENPVILLRINPGLSSATPQNDVVNPWIRRGNRLIELGIGPTNSPAVAPQFRSDIFRNDLPFSNEPIRVETRRRFIQPAPDNRDNGIVAYGDKNEPSQFTPVQSSSTSGPRVSRISPPSTNVTSLPADRPKLSQRDRSILTVWRSLLADEHGSVVLEGAYGSGQHIISSTPHLAANTYQTFDSNFEFLTDLLDRPDAEIWVDEYLHGYRNPPLDLPAYQALVDEATPLVTRAQELADAKVRIGDRKLDELAEAATILGNRARELGEPGANPPANEGDTSTGESDNPLEELAAAIEAPATAISEASDSAERLETLPTQARRLEQRAMALQEGLDAIASRQRGSWIEYLARTPLLLLLLQSTVAVAIAAIALNRPFGRRRPLSPRLVDNARAYIDALASVLYKANSTDFVASTIAKAERLDLQRALGLGGIPVERSALDRAWEYNTGRAATDLDLLFDVPQLDSDRALSTWLTSIRNLHRHLPTRQGTTAESSL